MLRQEATEHRAHRSRRKEKACTRLLSSASARKHGLQLNSGQCRVKDTQQLSARYGVKILHAQCSQLREWQGSCCSCTGTKVHHQKSKKCCWLPELATLSVLCLFTANRLQRHVLDLPQDIQANTQKELVRKRFEGDCISSLWKTVDVCAPVILQPMHQTILLLYLPLNYMGYF